MKKKNYYIMIGTLIILGILLLFSSASLQIVDAKYDVNGDGVIDIQDALETYGFIDKSMFDYDVDSSGLITIQDVLLIYNNIGNTPSEPGEDPSTDFDWFIDIDWW